MSKKKDSNLQKIINQINKDLDKINIYKQDKDQEREYLYKDNDNKIEGNKSFLSYKSFNSIDSSVISNASQITYVSEPFKEDKDLDLPNFSPMKYISFHWRISHSSTYMLYGLFLLISTFFWLAQYYNDKQCNTIMLISHIFYFISTFIQWFYYKRGCIGDSNYNSRVKANIDKSFRAKILRGEEGWKYFFSLTGASLLIYGNIYFILSGKIANPEYWNINLIGCMTISLSQIMKIEKILIENKHYIISNDLSHGLIEIFMFFGSLSYGTYYLIQILYNYDRETFKYLFMSLKMLGNVLIIFSGLCLLNRYFCSDFDDLNVSSLSNVTL